MRKTPLKRTGLKRKPGKPRKVKSLRRKLKDNLEKIVKEIVKKRDNCTCQHCLAPNLLKSNCHVSHVIPRSKSLLLSFDLLNLKVLCYHCHLNWWHKNPVEAGEWFKTKFPERWEYLKTKKDIVEPIKDFELENMYIELEKVKKLAIPLGVEI